MRRRSPAWYRYRMISGLLLGILGLAIAVRLALIPGPPQSKIAGFAFAVVGIALAAVRVWEFVRMRRDGGTVGR